MNQDIEVAHNKLSCLKHFSKQKLLLTKTVKIEIHYNNKKTREPEDMSNESHKFRNQIIYLDNLLRAVLRNKTELIMLSVLIDFGC